MVEELKIKLGFEFPAKTLEIINNLDPKLLSKIKELQDKGMIEIIGSGYTQNIFPLIPAEVNAKCLEFGNEVYIKLLGKQPEIALANEQVYSKSLPKLYLDAGYKALIIEWVNAYATNRDLKSLRYSCPIIKGNEQIRVLWNNFKCFQKLQRYVYGDFNIDEYLKFVMSNFSKKEDRVLNIYGNDMEVFDFRPKDVTCLHSGGIKFPEIVRIKRMFADLLKRPEIEFILPSEAINKKSSEEVYDVCSSEYPIITKKQEKYNVTRWAVCGKNNYISNTLCYKAYKLLKGGGSSEQWKRLVEYWASDNRTHTYCARYNGFREGVKDLIKELEVPGNKILEKKPSIEVPMEGIIETPTIRLELNKKKGGTIKSLIFKQISEIPLIATIPPEYFDDVRYTVDLFSGGTIMFIGEKQKTDLSDTNIRAFDKGDYIKVMCKNKLQEGLSLRKEYKVFKKESRVDLIIKINVKKRINPYYFRTGIITIHPKAFRKNELYYGVHNGGYSMEKYHLKEPIDQLDTVEMRVSSKHCLGSTEEVLEIGDRKKRLIIKTDKSILYSVPLLKFERIDDDYILRIFNSIIEKDNTSNTYLEGLNKITFSFKAESIEERENNGIHTRR